MNSNDSKSIQTARESWCLRVNTQDELVYNEVYVNNCYQVPGDLRGITVIDIGANIGAFSLLCLERGAERIVAFEPETSNFESLAKNLIGWAHNSRLWNVAIKGDLNINRTVALTLARLEGEIQRTGGHCSIATGSYSVNVHAISLSHVLYSICSQDENASARIWIKIDCEGAEHQILSSPNLPWDRIERIFGEIHDCRDGKISRDTGEVEFVQGAFGSLDGRRDSLVRHLEEKGFEVVTEQHPEDDRLSLFWAYNKSLCRLRNETVVGEPVLCDVCDTIDNLDSALERAKHGCLDSLSNVVKYAKDTVRFQEEAEKLKTQFSSAREQIFRDFPELSSSSHSVKTVAVLTPFRNARKHLQLYFKQISALRDELKKEGYELRLVAAEGDSLDSTRERIQELSSQYSIPFTLVDTTHGRMKWASVEDPVRMKVMSDVMNKALDEVKDSDDVVVWIMSDLEWSATDLALMVTEVDLHGNQRNIYAPFVFVGGERKLHSDSILSLQFYDTWAYRMKGARFSPVYPFNEGFRATTPGEISGRWLLDSAGTCLVMSNAIARVCRATDQEAVSFCADARNKDFSVILNADVSVYHAPLSRKRLLWISDAVCITGFSRVAHAMFPILAEAGFDLDIVAVNYWGTPHNFPYTIYPANVYGEDDSGNTRARLLVQMAQQQGRPYDAIVKLDDHWNISSLMAELERLEDKNINIPPIIPWVTVDGRNIKGKELEPCTMVLFSTQFGADEADECGYIGYFSTVPFGVDTKIFKPQDRVKSRSLVCHKDISPDAFIVGTVSTNQFRKRLDLTLSYFADWVGRYNVPVGSAYLYLCISGQHNDGIDIPSLIRYFGLKGRVILNDSLLPDEYLAHVYSAFDVFMSMSMGEGYGLCALEALACGIPAIVSDWSGYGSWVPEEVAYKIPCSAVVPMSPGNAPSYVMGGVADRDETVGALQKLYLYPELREKMSKAGVDFAQEMTWERTGQMLVSEIEKVIDRARDKAIEKQQQEELIRAREEARVYCESVSEVQS